MDQYEQWQSHGRKYWPNATFAGSYVYRRSVEGTGHFEREELWKRDPNEFVFRRICLRYTIPLFTGSSEGNSQKKKQNLSSTTVKTAREKLVFSSIIRFS